MDAETRHELKTNRLYDWLLKSKEWLDKWLNLILILVTVIFLSLAGWRWWSARQESALDAAWGVLNSARVENTSAGDQPLEELRQLIRENHDPALTAIARIELADGLLFRVTDEDSGAAKLSEAAEQLDAVVDSGVSPIIRAAALHRLAAVQESQNKFDAAKATYEKLKQTEFANSPFQESAQDRLNALAELPKSFDFLPGSAPVEAPRIQTPASTSAPASGPASSPAVAPAQPTTVPAQPASAPAPATPASQSATAPSGGA